MSNLEKTFTLVAVGYIIGLAAILVAAPSSRQMHYLLPLSLIGVAVNVGLLFVVFKDIFSRSFSRSWEKYFWLLIIFLFLPAVIIYLPIYGFRKR